MASRATQSRHPVALAGSRRRIAYPSVTHLHQNTLALHRSRASPTSALPKPRKLPSQIRREPFLVPCQPQPIHAILAGSYCRTGKCLERSREFNSY
jgi:hypothetical protein